MALNISEHIDQDCPNDDRYLNHFSYVKLRFSPMTTIIIYFIYLLPFCFGVFGNISVCLIFFQQKKLRSITNTFLMNLCLNDLIVLCVSIPMTLSAALMENWVFGGFLCKFLNFTPTLTALVSTFTVAIIAVERWFFIVNKKKFHRRCTLLTLMLLWTTSIIIALPEFILRHLEEYAPPPLPIANLKFSLPVVDINYNQANLTSPDYPIQPVCQMKKIYFCILNPSLHMRIFSYVVITVQYLVPFLFVSVSCYSISRFLKCRMKKMYAYQTHCSTTNNNNAQNKQNEKNENQPKRISLNNESQSEFNDDEQPAATAATKNNNNTSNHAAKRTRCSDDHRTSCRSSINFDRDKYRSSSIFETILMPSAPASQTHSGRRFHRSRKLLICVALLFTVSWLPLTVVQIYLEHNEQITQNEPNFVYAFLLIPCYLISSISACMNPVIYNYINRSFRREFYALYPCCFQLSLSLSATSRAHTTSVTSKRSQKQEFEHRGRNSNALPLRTKSKTKVRFISCGERYKHGKTSVVSINENL